MYTGCLKLRGAHQPYFPKIVSICKNLEETSKMDELHKIKLTEDDAEM